MKKHLAAFLLIFTEIVSASSDICEVQHGYGVVSAFNNSEFRAYVCPNNDGCDLNGFTALIDIKPVDISYGPNSQKYCAFFITPRTKGKQFPTLVFLASESARARMVLADYENGLSIGREGNKGFHDLISQAHPEPDYLVKTRYSWNGNLYIPIKTSCFRVIPTIGGKENKLISINCK